MHGWLADLEASLRTRRLLRDGQRILVAVSGGLDSVVLLHALHALAPRHRWRLVVAHFNHQLRGTASAGDERFVRALATRLGLPCVTGRWPKADHAAARQLGLEMAARLARHRFLARAARTARCPTVALAHHEDDQVELFFLRLLRGAGGEGLAGMKAAGPAWADPRLTLVRPLLGQTRADLAGWASGQRLRHRVDATNLDLDRDRNWLRHELLPRLARRFGEGSFAAILRTMEVAGVEARFAQEAAEAWLARPGARPWANLHPAVQRQAVVRQLLGLGVPAEFDLVERLRGQPGRPVTAAGGRRVVLNAAGKLAFTPVPAAEGEFDATEVTLDLRRAGARTLGESRVAWRPRPVTVRPGPRRPPRPVPGREQFDADRVGPTVRLRHWRPGDRFQPIGMAAAVKLQDLFTNGKIPAARRRSLWVAENAVGTLFWVEGLRIGEVAKLTPRTRRVLEWRWQPAG
jgi:tRNA(Ile)-lysidine synthase